MLVRFECLSHPTYSLNLALYDCHMSGSLKEALGGEKVQCGWKYQWAVHSWLQGQIDFCFPSSDLGISEAMQTRTEHGGSYDGKW